MEATRGSATLDINRYSAPNASASQTSCEPNVELSNGGKLPCASAGCAVEAVVVVAMTLPHPVRTAYHTQRGAARAAPQPTTISRRPVLVLRRRTAAAARSA